MTVTAASIIFSDALNWIIRRQINTRGLKSKKESDLIIHYLRLWTLQVRFTFTYIETSISF